MLKQSRLDSLSDGIFAIVLTLLTFEFKVPHIVGDVTDGMIWRELVLLWPVMLSFVLSFALIFTYWHAHHYIASVYAKTVDRRLTSINALFFFFVALIPFTASLLSSYHQTRVAIIVYSANILAIGFSLMWMRSYVLGSGFIDHVAVNRSEKRRGLIRVLVPMLIAAAAIAVSFYSTWTAFLLLTLAIVFNLISRSTYFVNWLLEKTKEEIAGS